MSIVQNHNNFHHTTISRTYNSIAKQREAKQIPSQSNQPNIAQKIVSHLNYPKETSLHGLLQQNFLL